MSSTDDKDIYAEIRKHAASKDKIKSENYRVLSDLEKSITNGKKRRISFMKYFDCIMAQLESKQENVRSVSICILLMTVAALSPPDCSSPSSRESKNRRPFRRPFASVHSIPIRNGARCASFVGLLFGSDSALSGNVLGCVESRKCEEEFSSATQFLHS